MSEEQQLRDRDITLAMADGTWEFNQSVADVFDEMLERSIPQYEVMRRAVFDVGARFVKRGTDVVDLGASRGESIQLLLRRFGATVRYLCIETSQPMASAFKDRYRDWIRSDVILLFEEDLRTHFPFAQASLVQSVLTLMFTPINYRQRLIQQSFECLLPGGAFVLVEKVLGEGARLDALEVELYSEMKLRNGYTQEEVDRKRLALEGVQVPVHASVNIAMLKSVGFREVDCFWRWMNFAAFVAVK